MTKTVPFTYVKFMSVVKTPSGDLSSLLNELADAGFIFDEDGLVNNNLLLLSRHILFSQKDIQQDILQMEKKVVLRILERHQPQGEWLSTLIQDEKNICIPKDKVKYDGRTVCVQVYNDLEAYTD